MSFTKKKQTLVIQAIWREKVEQEKYKDNGNES